MEQESTEQASDWNHAVADAQQPMAELVEMSYSTRMLEEARRPRNRGIMLDPDGHAALSASCGDTIELFLRLNGSRIAMAAFMTNGCAPTAACGSMLTAMVRGLTLGQAGSIDTADLIIALDGLPPERVHCATLAVNTLRKATGQCTELQSQGVADRSEG